MSTPQSLAGFDVITNNRGGITPTRPIGRDLIEDFPGAAPQDSDEFDDLPDSDGGGGPTSPTDPDGGPGSDVRPETALESVRVSFPWVESLGLTDTIVSWIIEGVSDPAEIISRLRQTPEYQGRFPSIRRQDGTLRMSEGQYLRAEDEYREILNRYGQPGADYGPADLGRFFDNEIGASELDQRFQLYDSLRRSSNEIRTAFFVFAGIPLSDDDLYAYVVDPNRRAELDVEYNNAVSGTDLDYQTYIGRVTAIGLDSAQRASTALAESGIDTTALDNSLLNTNAEIANAFVDALNTGGSLDGGRPLALNELVSAFEMAMLGSAALEQGLALPTQERLEAFRAAGVGRAQALQTYGQFVRDRGLLSGALQRSRGREITQFEFEEAQLLADGNAQNSIRAALAQEATRSNRTGSVRFSEDQSGRLTQRGFVDSRN